MSTLLQEKLAQNIIEAQKHGKRSYKKSLVVLSGYAEVTADRHSKTIIEQVGVQKALEKYGFTEDNAKKVVADILLSKRSKDENKLKASDQIFKVHGTYAPVKAINVELGVMKEKTDAELEELAYKPIEPINEALQSDLSHAKPSNTTRN